MTDRFELHLGDCRDVLRSLPDCSIDSIVTDPPYHLVANKKDDPRRASPEASQRNKGFMGMVWDGGDVAMRPETWAECLRVLKPGGHLLAFSGSRTYHRMACAIEDAGFEMRDQIMWIYGSGFPKSHNLDGDWEGWGTALKPAHEPICVARKPLVGTVARNMLEHGTGALNIAACRVATEETLRAGAGGIPCRHDENVARGRSGEASADRRYADEGGTDFAMKPGPRGGDPAGRWPANVIHDGSDAVIAAFPDAPGQLARSSSSSRKSQNVYGAMARNGYGGIEPRAEADQSAARFFYCAKASRADRNEGLDSSSTPAVATDATMRQCEKADWSTRNGNHHPTVKPTDLMAYLCRLVTPLGGVVLDPFMGSGSTGKAAMREGFRFIGIDMTPEYVEIARARIAHALNESERAATPDIDPRQQSLFDQDMETTA